MKHYFFTLLLIGLLWPLSSIQADELTASQQRFRNTLMQFLREEGFSPTIDDSDNSVNFKKEGKKFWITIENESPFYLEVHRSGLDCEDANQAVAILACNHANATIRSAKAIYNSKSALVSFAVEMYCHSVEEFKYVFYKCVSVLESSEKAVKDFYAEHSESSDTPFSITSVAMGIQDENSNIVTNYGEKIYDFRTKYIAPQITVDVNKAGSYELYVKFFTSDGTLSRGSSSPTGYSYKHTVKMEQGIHKYTLSGWGSNNAGNWKMGDYRIEIYYDGNKVATKSFTVY